MKRVLLINPHDTNQDGFTNPPLGLLYLAGTLVQHDLDVRIIDGSKEGKDAIIEVLSSFMPEIVGVTCLTPGRKRAIEVACLTKQIVGDIPVVFGGAHATIMYRQMLEHYPEIDFIVLGEGEQTFLELVSGVEPQNICGLAYRHDGAVLKTRQRHNVSNLDEIPFPAWHLLDLSRYSGWGDGKYNGIVLSESPRISVIFSRGCTGHCDFCSTWWIWKGWRSRSAKNMTDELEMLYRNYGICHFCFADDAMTVDRLATIELCNEIIRRNLKIAFHITTRTDCVDEEMLLKLKQAGCYMVAFGIETGSPQLLKEMGKENDIVNSEKAISMCKKVKLPVSALLIIGNVGETEESVLETRDLLRRTLPDVVGCTGALWVLPGTKLYRDCCRKGIIDDSFWLGDNPYMIYLEEYTLEQLAAFSKTILSYQGVVRRIFCKIKYLPNLLYKFKRLLQ